jgi:hypothetical protein
MLGQDNDGESDNARQKLSDLLADESRRIHVEIDLCRNRRSTRHYCAEARRGLQQRHARRFGGFARQQHGDLQQHGQGRGGSGGQNLSGGKVNW